MSFSLSLSCFTFCFLLFSFLSFYLFVDIFLSVLVFTLRGPFRLRGSIQPYYRSFPLYLFYVCIFLSWRNFYYSTGNMPFLLFDLLNLKYIYIYFVFLWEIRLKSDTSLWKPQKKLFFLVTWPLRGGGAVRALSLRKKTLKVLFKLF